VPKSRQPESKICGDTRVLATRASALGSCLGHYPPVTPTTYWGNRFRFHPWPSSVRKRRACEANPACHGASTSSTSVLNHQGWGPILALGTGVFPACGKWHMEVGRIVEDFAPASECPSAVGACQQRNKKRTANCAPSCGHIYMSPVCGRTRRQRPPVNKVRPRSRRRMARQPLLPTRGSIRGKISRVGCRPLGCSHGFASECVPSDKKKNRDQREGRKHRGPKQRTKKLRFGPISARRRSRSRICFETADTPHGDARICTLPLQQSSSGPVIHDFTDPFCTTTMRRVTLFPERDASKPVFFSSAGILLGDHRPVQRETLGILSL